MLFCLHCCDFVYVYVASNNHALNNTQHMLRMIFFERISTVMVVSIVSNGEYSRNMVYKKIAFISEIVSKN